MSPPADVAELPGNLVAARPRRRDLIAVSPRRARQGVRQIAGQLRELPHDEGWEVRVLVQSAESTRQTWLQQRKAGIGATDAAVILGLSKWKSPLALYAEKAGLIDESDEEHDALEWGRRLEPVIAQKYEEVTGRSTYDPGAYEITRHASERWMCATLDRIVTAPPADGALPYDSPGVLELKTAAAWARDQWDNEPPPIYQVQVQHQLAVTGHLWGSIAVLIGGRTFRWQDIERNETFIERLMKLEHEFWLRVQRRDPPPPDGTRATTDMLATLYPAEQHDLVQLPAEASGWDMQRETAIKAIEQADERKREAENRIKAAIGDHAIGQLPNGVRYHWKSQTRKAYTVDETSFRKLTRIEVRS
jgi:putative phage-type endonuclease